MTRNCSLLFFFVFLCGTSLLSAQEEGFKPLFNGKDLTGWEGNPNLWRVEDGMIVGETAADGDKKVTYNTFLVYKEEVPKNFVLRFDYWLSKQGNSGMQYRSWPNEDKTKPYSIKGYQADFDGQNAHSGIMYGEGFRGILAGRGLKTEVGDDGKPKTLETFADTNELKNKIKVEDWNSYEIIADGYTFTHKINGETMSICVDNDMKRRRDSGVLAIQLHIGPPMQVKIRNLRIKPLP